MTAERYAWFFAFGFVMWGVGFALGFRVMPSFLRTPYPSREVGLIVFKIGLPYIVLRSLYLAIVSPDKLFEWQAILGAYVHLIVLSMACIRGYRYYKKRKYRPQTIKAGLVVGLDGGLHLVEPQLVEETYVREVAPAEEVTSDAEPKAEPE